MAGGRPSQGSPGGAPSVKLAASAARKVCLPSSMRRAWEWRRRINAPAWAARALLPFPRPSAHPALLTKKTIGILTAPRTVRGRQYPYRCKVVTEIYMWAATAAEIIFCRRSISSPGRVFLLWKSMSASVVMGMRWMWAWGTSRPITASPMRLQGTA